MFSVCVEQGKIDRIGRSRASPIASELATTLPIHHLRISSSYSIRVHFRLVVSQKSAEVSIDELKFIALFHISSVQVQCRLKEVFGPSAGDIVPMQLIPLASNHPILASIRQT